MNEQERISQERALAARHAPPDRSRAKPAKDIAHSVHDTPDGVMESRERMLRERVAAVDTERMACLRPAQPTAKD